jgi:hypothetical protein
LDGLSVAASDTALEKAQHSVAVFYSRRLSGGQNSHYAAAQQSDRGVNRFKGGGSRGSTRDKNEKIIKLAARPQAFAAK